MSGKILIVLDKPYYMSGEMVSGRVDLDISRPTQAAGLMLKWKGFERTLVEITITIPGANGQPPEQRRDRYKDNNEFFHTPPFMVFNFGGAGVAPGRYSYPFNFQLPQGIPGVFHYERTEFNGDRVKAAVVYKVKCWLDMPGKDIKRTEKIVISEAVTKQIVPIHEENKKSFLFAKGELKLRVDVAKNVFIPGEPIPIAVSVHNESSKKVEALKVKLMRAVDVRAKIIHRNRIDEVSRIKYEGVLAHSNTDQVLQFQIDQEVYPSTNGKLVHCKYHLDIECDVAMAFDLEVHPPVVIALLPALGQPVWIYQNYGPRGW